MDLPSEFEALKTIVGAPGETIKPGHDSDLASFEGRAIADLAAIGDRHTLSGRLEILGTLGEGGMGVVRLGRQLALHREVAVKELLEARRGSDSSVLKLLQEAWLAGSLEHPNVVPVYDIEVEEDGEPRIVMKRIQGSPWGDLMADGEAVAERFGEHDLLEWNLMVWLQVANAVRYAHDRGIVHLDLKPDNVMLGAFGEVYLVDWGLAMSLEPGGDGRFPLASAVNEVIGTPSYLAPEMLSRDGSKLCRQTDVYLMGSVLFEILSGSPPHQGDSLIAIFYQAATTTPELPDAVPEELRAICRRAMAMDPADRYESVDAFRAAVRLYLQSRGSRALSDEARKQMEVLHSATGKPLSAEPEEAQAQRDEVHRAFNEARFGFRQALAAWPDNRDATDGLRETLLTMVELLLGAGDAPAAASMLSQAEDPPAELRGRVEEARRRHAAEAARIKELERLGDDMDLAIGRRTRLFVLGLLGTLFACYPLYAWIFPGSPESYQRQFTIPAFYLGLALVLGYFGRESLGRTLVNRRLFSTLVTLLLAQMLLVGIAWWHELGSAAVAALMFFLWTLVSSFIAQLIEHADAGLDR